MISITLCWFLNETFIEPVISTQKLPSFKDPLSIQKLQVKYPSYSIVWETEIEHYIFIYLYNFKQNRSLFFDTFPK